MTSARAPAWGDEGDGQTREARLAPWSPPASAWAVRRPVAGRCLTRLRVLDADHDAAARLVVAQVLEGADQLAGDRMETRAAVVEAFGRARSNWSRCRRPKEVTGFKPGCSSPLSRSGKRSGATPLKPSPAFSGWTKAGGQATNACRLAREMERSFVGPSCLEGAASESCPSDTSRNGPEIPLSDLPGTCRRFWHLPDVARLDFVSGLYPSLETLVTRGGLEPPTKRLRVFCSTIELAGPRRARGRPS